MLISIGTNMKYNNVSSFKHSSYCHACWKLCGALEQRDTSKFELGKDLSIY